MLTNWIVYLTGETWKIEKVDLSQTLLPSLGVLRLTLTAEIVPSDKSVGQGRGAINTSAGPPISPPVVGLSNRALHWHHR
ncbi:MAG: hypothetical protein NZ959_05400 [Armatimonadetes bacterium]|nr:hypothetical protein [Armatimonadota bacterium]MDW8123100.1 hypothetical protein [Armatimonadota bacterium]